MQNLKSYLSLIRVEYWSKNVAIIPGVVLAYFLHKLPTALFAGTVSYDVPTGIYIPVLLAVISACFISASNYIMNEYLDRATDRFHPVKNKRVLVHTPLNPHYVILMYLLFLFAGLLIAHMLGSLFFITSIGLLINGIVYNLKPMRTKDIAYVDVLVESFSNPMRFMLGWYAITSQGYPPLLILLSYWFFGTYLMCMKRKQELAMFTDMNDAVQYRGSYATYTTRGLLKYALLMLAASIILFLVYVIDWIGSVQGA